MDIQHVFADTELLQEGRFEAVQIPVLPYLFVADVATGEAVNDADAHVGNHVGDAVGIHDGGALGVDDFALFVGDVIVFEQVFARVEVVRFDFALCAFDLFGDHTRFDGFIFAHAETRHHGGHTFASEDAHEIVVEGDVEATGTGVALTAGATAQLVVDTA